VKIFPKVLVLFEHKLWDLVPAQIIARSKFFYFHPNKCWRLHLVNVEINDVNTVWHAKRYINKNRGSYRFLDSWEGGGGKPKISCFLSHTSQHIVVLFGKTHIVCSRLPRFGHQMAGQMWQNSCWSSTSRHRELYFRLFLFMYLCACETCLSINSRNKKSTRCRFHQRFTSSFYVRRSQKRKKILRIWLNSYAFGIYVHKSCT